MRAVQVVSSAIESSFHSPLGVGEISGSSTKWANEFPELRAFDDVRLGILQPMAHTLALSLAIGEAKTASPAR